MMVALLGPTIIFKNQIFSFRLSSYPISGDRLSCTSLPHSWLLLDWSPNNLWTLIQHRPSTKMGRAHRRNYTQGLLE